MPGAQWLVRMAFLEIQAYKYQVQNQQIYLLNNDLLLAYHSIVLECTIIVVDS